MTTENKRINLKVGTASDFAATTEVGTPGIRSDADYRFAWFAGSAWRLAAMRGASENFTELQIGGTTRIDSLGRGYFPSVTVSSLTQYALPRALSVGGMLADSCFSDDGTNAGCSRPLTVEGSRVRGGLYGALYRTSKGTTAQSIPTGTAWTKITPFDGAFESGMTASAANDNITIARAGAYAIGFSRTYLSGTANVILEVAVCLNGIPVPQSIMSTQNGNTNTPIYADLDIPVVCAAGDVVDIRLRHDAGNPVNITYQYATLGIWSID